MQPNITQREVGVEIKLVGRFGYLAATTATFYAERKANFNQAALFTNVQPKGRYHEMWDKRLTFRTLVSLIRDLDPDLQGLVN